MAKPLYNQITTELLHQVATLTAAGVRPFAIATRTGVSIYTVRQAMRHADYPAIHEAKVKQFAAMMGGE